MGLDPTGGPNARVAASIFDSQGNLYAIGTYSSTIRLGTGPGTPTLTNTAGRTNSFVAKYAPGGGLSWARGFGPGNAFLSSLAVDAAGAVYLAGTVTPDQQESTIDLDPGPGTVPVSSDASLVLMKLDTNGMYQWSNVLSGSIFNTMGGIALDGAGHIYIAGGFAGPMDFDPGPGVTELSSVSVWSDGFVARYDAADGSLGWARALVQVDGAIGMANSATALAWDAAHAQLVVGGGFSGTVDFDPGPGLATRTTRQAGSYSDPYLVRLGADGSFARVEVLLRTDSFSGSHSRVDELAVDAFGAVSITATLQGPLDLDPGAGVSVLAPPAGGRNQFVAHYRADGSLAWSREIDDQVYSSAPVVAMPGGGVLLGVGYRFAGAPYPLFPDDASSVPPLARFADRRFARGAVVVRLGAAGELIGMRQVDGDPTAGGTYDTLTLYNELVLPTALSLAPDGDIALAGTFLREALFGSMRVQQAPVWTSWSGFVTRLEPLGAAPGAPAAPVLDAASDTGFSASDGVTNDTTPSFRVGGAAPGQFVELFYRLPFGGLWPVGRGSSSGLIEAENLNYDSPQVVARIVDPVNGPGPFSSATSVTIDTKLPNVVLPFGLSTDVYPGEAAARRLAAGSVLASSAEEGTVVELIDESGRVLATDITKRGPFGIVAYSLTIPADLRGMMRLGLRGRDPAGNVVTLPSPFRLVEITAPNASGGGGGVIPVTPAGPRVLSAVWTKVKVGRKKVQALVVAFDGDLAAASAEQKSLYSMSDAGRDRRFNTRDDKSLSFKSAAYDQGRRAVTLVPRAVPTKKQMIRFTISDRLASTLGRRLDGNGDGLEGDSYFAYFGPAAKG